MSTHSLHCQDPWFSLIKQGIKTVEGRKNSPKYRHWKPGDTLVFLLDNKSFKTIIVGIRHYKSLEDYLIAEGFDQVLPGVRSFSDAMTTYLQWNTKEDIDRNGFVGIEVKLVET